MTFATAALVFLALLGHAALWVGLANRTHSFGISREVVRVISGPCEFMLVAVPLYAFWAWWQSSMSADDFIALAREHDLVHCYAIVCWALAGLAIVLWVRRKVLSAKQLPIVLSNRTAVVDVAAQLGRLPLSGFSGRLFALVPWNQVVQIAVHEVELEIARLPKSLDGFSIVLLSDLHITGHIGIEFYHAVVDETNRLQPDMVAICGDIIDDLAHLDWLPKTLGRLRARHGAYYVLGNHDRFTKNVPLVRQTLNDAGLTNVGGRFQSVQVGNSNSGSAEMIVAGNELPWLKPAAAMETCPPRFGSRPQLRVLLAHTPDQFPWARRHDFDLMMAGHTHGGQCRLPVIGPIFSPSWYGVRYAGGIFSSPPTAMYISRGVAAETPLRINCRPELAKLVLRCQLEG